MDPDAYVYRWDLFYWGQSQFDFFASYQFVISPPGKGTDCFRTWIALAVGSIPIVEYDPNINSLFEDLPIIVLQDWHDLNKTLLESSLRHFETTWGSMRFEKMSSRYWASLFLSEIRKINPEWRPCVQDCALRDILQSRSKIAEDSLKEWQQLQFGNR